jgi:hypothetical protein
MVVSILGRTGVKAGTRIFGSSAGRAAAAGAGGGMLLDDVPGVGGLIDPTEWFGDGGGDTPFGVDMQTLVLVAIVLLVVWQVSD